MKIEAKRLDKEEMTESDWEIESTDDFDEPPESNTERLVKYAKAAFIKAGLLERK